MNFSKRISKNLLAVIVSGESTTALRAIFCNKNLTLAKVNIDEIKNKSGGAGLPVAVALPSAQVVQHIFSVPQHYDNGLIEKLIMSREVQFFKDNLPEYYWDFSVMGKTADYKQILLITTLKEYVDNCHKLLSFYNLSLRYVDVDYLAKNRAQQFCAYKNLPHLQHKSYEPAVDYSKLFNSVKSHTIPEEFFNQPELLGLGLRVLEGDLY